MNYIGSSRFKATECLLLNAGFNRSKFYNIGYNKTMILKEKKFNDNFNAINKQRQNILATMIS